MCQSEPYAKERKVLLMAGVSLYHEEGLEWSGVE